MFVADSLKKDESLLLLNESDPFLTQSGVFYERRVSDSYFLLADSYMCVADSLKKNESLLLLNESDPFLTQSGVFFMNPPLLSGKTVGYLF